MHYVAKICATTLPIALTCSTVSAQTSLFLTIEFKNKTMKESVHIYQMGTNVEVMPGVDKKHRLDFSRGQQFRLEIRYKQDQFPGAIESFRIKPPVQTIAFEVQDSLQILEYRDCINDNIEKISELRSVSKSLSAKILRSQSDNKKVPCADPDLRKLFDLAISNGPTEFRRANSGFIF